MQDDGHSGKSKRRSDLYRAAADAVPVIDRLESRQLFCTLHYGLGDVFDPTARHLGVEAPDYVARVNFGPSQTRAVPGYSKDSGLSFGPRSGGAQYGWTDDSVADGKVRRSVRAQDDRYDSFLTTPASGATWELAVPNGIYTVRLAAGDARKAGGSFGFSVEGITAIDGSASKQQRWLESTVTVAVSDGRLSVQSLPGSKPGKINFIDVARSDSQQLSLPATQGSVATPGKGRLDDAPTLSGLTVVNATSDQDVLVLTSGVTLRLSEIGNQLNVRAMVEGDAGSVQFVLNDAAPVVDSVAPFALAGDVSGDYQAWTPAAGTYTLVATPYTGADASGTAGLSMTVTFTVVDDGVSPPTSPPESPPVPPPPPPEPPPPPPPPEPPPVPPPPVSPPPPVPVKINFQPQSAPTVNDYLVDAGYTYAARNGQSYGWTTSHLDAMLDRNAISDQLRDTHVAVKAAARWELAVPNGKYTVRVGVGDSAASSRDNVWVEGVQLYNYVSLGANQFRSDTISVEVKDGRLTIGIGSAATGTTRINFVEVTSQAVPPVSPPAVPPSVPPASPPAVPPVSPPAVPPTAPSDEQGVRIDFQPSASPTVTGYLVDGGATFASRNGQSYGWSVSHADAVFDRNAISDQKLDTLVAVKAGARWELAVPNGQYVVTVGIGDSAASSRNNVWIEGVWHYAYVQLGAGQFSATSRTVNVTDGRLTLAFGQTLTGETRLTHIDVVSTAVPPTSPPPTSPPSTSPPPTSPPPTSPPPTSPPPTSPPPTSPPPASSGVKVNFQPSWATTVDGYSIDSGGTYGNRDGRSYGWTTSHTDAVFDRNSNSDQRLDTHVAVKAGSKWELSVPNGQYVVTVTVGDSAASSRNNVWIEGIWHYNYVSLPANQFRSIPVTVNVTDGRITLEFGQSPTGETRITDLEVVSSSPPTSPPPTSPPPPTVPPPPPGGPIGGTISLTLLNSTTDQPIGPLMDEQVIDMRQVGSRLNIEASPSHAVGSVQFFIDDALIATETTAPYALGELSGYRNFADWTPTAGAHVLRVVPFEGASGTGVAGEPMVVRFSVTDLSGNTTPPSALPVSVNWSTVTDSPVSRAESLGTYVNGKLYVFGGLDGSVLPGTREFAAMRRADVFNPSTNIWSRIADVPEALTHTTAVVIGSQIWFVGGYTGTQPSGGGHNRVHIYNTLNNTWSRGPNLPVAHGAGGAAVIGNTLYYIAGTSADRTVSVGDLFALNLNNQSEGWQRLATMPNPRNHLAVTALEGKLYAIGGQIGQQATNQPLTLVHAYDPQTNVWTRVADMPSARTHTTNSIVIYRDRIVVVGGENGYDKPQRELLAYDPDYDTWKVIGLLPSSRSTAVAGLLDDGRIISATGNNPGATRTTWIGTPVFAG